MPWLVPRTGIQGAEEFFGLLAEVGLLDLRSCGRQQRCAGAQRRPQGGVQPPGVDLCGGLCRLLRCAPAASYKMPSDDSCRATRLACST